MTSGAPDFKKWFDKLVKNKMGGAALPVTGMSLGYGIMQAARLVPLDYEDDVALLGFRLLVISVILFVGAMVIYLVLWARHIATKFR